MIRRIEGLPREVFALELSGRITRDEVEEAMNLFDTTISESYYMAFFLDFLPNSQDISNLSNDIRFNNRLSLRGRTKRFAVAGNKKWRKIFDEISGFICCEARMFDSGHRNEAVSWLLTAPFLNAHDDDF